MGITTTKLLKNNSYHRSLFPVVGSSATAMLLLSFHSGAADWTITPNLGLKETYTDNVRLTQNNQISDFVTQINPGISLTGLGPHIHVDAHYVMNNVLYADQSDRNATNHQLHATANAELLDDFFFVDAKGSISQQSISSFGPQTTDNTNITNNRTNVETYSVSPYLLNHYKNFAKSEIRYTHDSVSTTGTGSTVSTGLSDSQSDKIQMKLKSGTDFRILGWGLNYSKERIDFDTGQTVDLESYGGDLSYLVTPHLKLITTGGYETNNYLSISGKSTGGPYWTGGFEWNPSQRTSIAASVGKRFFGNTSSVKASHRSHRTAWNLSYNEDITTTRSQFLLPSTIDTADFLDRLWTSIIPDPVVRQQIVDGFIRDNGLPSSLADSVNLLTNRFFLQKSLRASVSITGTRSTGVLSVFEIKRTAQTSQSADSALLGTSDLALLDNTKQVGINALWNHKITSLVSANINAAYTRTTSPETGREDNYKTLRIGLTKEFQPKVNGTIEVRRNELDTNQSGDLSYKENSILASVNIRF
jgi:uncharacterized protein (PEP-CTERM system associated)